MSTMQRSIITDQIDGILDDTKLRKAEKIMAIVLERMTRKQCEICFKNYPSYRRLCLSHRMEQRVEVLNRYRC